MINPLLSGPVVTKLGVKLFDAFGLNGNRFSTEDDAGETAQLPLATPVRPVNCALSGFTLAAPTLRQASTMLLVGSPTEMSDGIVSTTGFVSVVRKPS